jgi:hypothetical protein
MSFQTEFEFILPRGFIDSQGRLHRQGRMRLATATDEIEALQHVQAQLHEAYLPLLLISRVVTQLGELPAITPQVIGNLFAADLAYLEDLYERINSHESIKVGATCPYCDGRFQLQVAPLV